MALGRAIVRNAKVFLMDEPLSNLDAKLRVQMRAEITKLHNQLQTTTIYVTHDQTEAMTMASRIVVLKDGDIQQVGTPKKVYEEPKNVFVGGFIGSPGMNFFRGTLTDSHVVIDKWTLRVPKEKLEKLQQLGYMEKEIILGVRPENFYDEQAMLNTANLAKITINVEVSELLGAETYIYSNYNGQSFVARVSSATNVRNHSKINLMLDMDKVHFFDAQTEERINLE